MTQTFMTFTEWKTELPTTSTDTGEATHTLPGSLSTDDAAEAFLARWTKEDAPDGSGEPSDKSKEGISPDKTLTSEGTTIEEGAEETPAPSEEEVLQKKYAEDEEVFVKIKEGDKEHEVTLKDLKRLFGQEASLTRKGQEVAELRKKADTDTAKALAGLTVMTEMAKQRADPYKKIDFLVAAKDLDADTLQHLRTEAQKAFEEERFLNTELDNFVKGAQTQQQQRVVEDARACVKALNDETGQYHIKGWNDKVYDELRSFAIKEGVDQTVINGVTNPAVIKLLHMALQFSKSMAKNVTTKVNKTPKKIVKTTSTIQPKRAEDVTEANKKAMDKLKRSGKVDDAAEAFLARWSKSSDE
jgi:hypothetical protein